MQKRRFRSDPENLRRFPDPLAGLRGPTSKGMGKGREVRPPTVARILDKAVAAPCNFTQTPERRTTVASRRS